MGNSDYDYNKGQQEGASGKEWDGPSTDPNHSYNKGYNHGKGQRDGYNNEHSSYRSGNSQYESGWSSGSSSSGSSSGGSSGCFITTATLNALGKPDNCDELNVFREFRDKWLAKQEYGSNLISEYYRFAPEIVKQIDVLPNHDEVYSVLWQQSIKPCLALIKSGQNKEAEKIYCSAVYELKKRFLPQ